MTTALGEFVVVKIEREVQLNPFDGKVRVDETLLLALIGSEEERPVLRLARAVVGPYGAPAPALFDGIEIGHRYKLMRAPDALQGVSPFAPAEGS